MISSASGPIFMFCAPRRIFSCIEGDVSRFRQYRGRRFPFSCFSLPDRTHFRRYWVRRVPLSCFALPHEFSAVPSASGPIFIFCEPRLIFDDTEGVGSLFHVLRSRTCFWRCGGCWVPFSCFAHPNMFSSVPRASGPLFQVLHSLI
jgi:hypothetical protein